MLLDKEASLNIMVNKFGDDTVGGGGGKRGSPGPVGRVGPASKRGRLGPVGGVGPSGKRGAPGPAGGVGPSGIQGLKGDPGIVGPVGPKGSRGPKGVRGVVGAVGPRGEGFSPTFFSKRFAGWLYDILNFSFYFTTEKSGLIFKGETAVGIKNQVATNHANAIYKVEQIIKIPDYGYGLEFSKSMYEINDISWAIGVNSKAVLIFTFKITKWPSHYQYLFYTENDERAVILKGTNIVIKGSKSSSVDVKYKINSWNTCYIEFNNQDFDSIYEINGEKGTFRTYSETFSEDRIYIGGKEGQYFFQGVIARFDFLSIPMFTNEHIPDSIKESFLKENYDIVDDNL